MKKIAIVGSRKFEDACLIDEFIAALPPGSVVLTGDASGACAIVAEACHVLKVPYKVYRWNREGVRSRAEACSRIFERDLQIARECDCMHVFFKDELTAGSRFEAHAARNAGKPVTLHGSFFGQTTLEEI